MLNRVALGVAVAVCVSCQVHLDVPRGAVVECEDSESCPQGQTCRNGLCVDSDAETTPPVLVGKPTVTPSAGRAGTTFVVSFEVSEALLRKPRVTLHLTPPVDLECTAETIAHYACSYTATGEELEGEGGLVLFDVELIDAAVNRTVDFAAGIIHLDYQAPHALTVLPTYRSPSLVGVELSSAAADTIIEVLVVADEGIDPAVVPSLHATMGTEVIDFGPPIEVLPQRVAFAASPGSRPDGNYALSITWADTLGNVADQAPLGRDVAVLTTALTMSVDQTQVTYLRSPSGSLVAETLPAFPVPAGRFFAIAGSDPLTSGPTLPLATFTGNRALVAVRLWGDAALTLALGTIEATPAGWPATRLAPIDVGHVYATGYDGAGNRSPAVLVENHEWIGTSTAPTASTISTSISTATVAQPGDLVRLAAVPAAGADGTTIAVPGEGYWTKHDPGTLRPDAVGGPAMADDPVRGRLVLYGGTIANQIFSNDLWELDGQTWREIEPVPGTPWPGQLYGHRMTYDAARGRVVLFAGCSGAEKVWEWNGTVWSAVDAGANHPGARMNYGFAYDSRRDRVLLFGGASCLVSSEGNDLWEWDGESWEQITPSGLWPPTSDHIGMAFDEARGVMVVLTGDGGDAPNVWEWNGSIWTQTIKAAGAEVRSQLTYDSNERKIVSIGRYPIGTNPTQVWVWDGSNWEDRTQAAPVSPTFRSNQSVAFFRAAGRTVLFGGDNGIDTPSNDYWQWDGHGWIEPLAAAPARRSFQSFAADPTGRRLIMFGGGDNGSSAVYADTWAWTGAGWRLLINAAPHIFPYPPTPTPPWRHQYAFAFDPFANLTRMWGHGPAGLHSFDGTSWAVTAEGGTPPAHRSYTETWAYDPIRQGLVMFGGTVGGSPTADNYLFKAGSWSVIAGATPPARDGHAMATTAAGAIVQGGGPGLDDLWLLGPTGWAELPDGGQRPLSRIYHALAYNPQRGTIVMYGDPGLGNESEPALWEWSPAAGWRPRSPTRFDPPLPFAHAFGWDPIAKQMVSFGGLVRPAGSPYGNRDGDTWLWRDPVDRQPAVALDVRLPEDVDKNGITGLRVRYACGGSSDEGNGAALWAWSTRSAPGEILGWRELDDNAAPVSGATTVTMYAAADAGAAQALVQDRDGRIVTQCRPLGGSPIEGPEAVVGIDYLEVRVRYRTTP